MKRFFLFLLFFTLYLHIGGVKAAIYYVDQNCTGVDCDTSPYDTWGKAADNASDPMVVINASGNGAATDFVYIAPGTYNAVADYISLVDADAAGTSYIGIEQGADVAVYPNGHPSVNSTVILDASNPYAVYATANGDAITLRNLTIISDDNRGVYTLNGADTWKIYDCIFEVDAADDGSILLDFQGNDSFEIWRSIFRGGKSTSAAINFDGDTTGSLNYCIIEPGGGNAAQSYKRGIEHNGESAIVLNNLVIVGALNEAILNQSTGDFTIYNSIISGCYSTSSSCATIEDTNAGGGDTDVYNSIVLDNPYTMGDFKLNENVYSNNLENGRVAFVNSARKGFIIPSIDDSGGGTYVDAVEDRLSERGMEGTWFIDQDGWEEGSYSATVPRTFLTAGVIEIAAHSYSHTDLDIAHAGFIDCTAGCGGGEQYKIDQTAGEIYIDEDGDNSEEATYSISTNDLEAFDDWLEGGGGGGLSNTWDTEEGDDPGAEARLDMGLLLTSLADTGGWLATGDMALDIGTDTDCSDGCDGFYEDEIKNVKTWMADTLINGGGNLTDPQTGATYVARTFANPYNANDADYRAATKSSGYIGATNELTQILAQVDVYRVFTLTSGNLIGADEAETIGRIRSIGLAAAFGGIIVRFLGHNDSEIDSSDLSPGDANYYKSWSCILDTLNEFGDDLEVTSFQLALDEIRASPWNDSGTGNDAASGDGIWSRQYTTYSDFKLLLGSSARDAALDRSLTEDFDRTDVPKGHGPDIGAFEYSYSNIWRRIWRILRR
jgi:hypothetical protein